MKKTAKHIGLMAAGFACCIFPAVSATLYFFPLWQTSDKRISFLSVLLLVVCCLPFWRYIRQALKSPSVWQIYLVGGILLYAVNAIAADVAKIFLFSAPFSVLGAVLFKVAERIKAEEEKDTTEGGGNG